MTKSDPNILQYLGITLLPQAGGNKKQGRKCARESILRRKNHKQADGMLSKEVV